MVILVLIVVLMSETKVIFVLCKSLCSLLILILLLLLLLLLIIILIQLRSRSRSTIGSSTCTFTDWRSSESPGINEGLEFGVRPLDGQGYRVPRAHRWACAWILQPICFSLLNSYDVLHVSHARWWTITTIIIIIIICILWLWGW